MVRLIGPQDLERVDEPPVLQDRLIESCDLRVTIAGVTMRMRFDDAAVSDRFALRYRLHLSSQPADMTFNYARDADGAHYFWSDVATWRWPAERLSLEAIVLLIDAAAMSALVRSNPGLLSFHAAALLHGEFAVGIVGDSTAGKTTTTVACARRGMQVYSDERLLLRNGYVLPFLRAFNIRGHGASLLYDDGLQDQLAAALAARASSEDWSDLCPLDVMPHLSVPAPHPLRAIFLLSGKDARASAEPLHAPLACPRLLASIDCASLERLDRAAAIMTLLRNVNVFHLTLGTPDESARVIETALRRMHRDAA